MRKKLYARFYRFLLNTIPCVRGGGGRVIFLSKDFTHLTVKLGLNWRTRNVVGTIYGGSLYASTDPMFMLMLMRILGKNYVVWDKGCTIRFKRPAKTTLFAEFVITPERMEEVRRAVERQSEATFTWRVEYRDRTGKVYAEFDKTLYVAQKEFYRAKLAARNRSKTVPEPGSADPGSGTEAL